jgi:phage tail protein X
MSIRINIDKAKAIKLDQLRAERAPKLAALDLAFMRAVERGDLLAQASIAAEKQALRDVTKVTLPDDVATLKDFIPDILK